MYILVALEAALAVLLFWWYVSQEDTRLPAAGDPQASEPARGTPVSACCRFPARRWCWSGWPGFTPTTPFR